MVIFDELGLLKSQPSQATESAIVAPDRFAAVNRALPKAHSIILQLLSVCTRKIRSA